MFVHQEFQYMTGQFSSLEWKILVEVEGVPRMDDSEYLNEQLEDFVSAQAHKVCL